MGKLLIIDTPFQERNSLLGRGQCTAAPQSDFS